MIYYRCSLPHSCYYWAHSTPLRIIYIHMCVCIVICVHMTIHMRGLYYIYNYIYSVYTHTVIHRVIYLHYLFIGLVFIGLVCLHSYYAKLSVVCFSLFMGSARSAQVHVPISDQCACVKAWAAVRANAPFQS